MLLIPILFTLWLALMLLLTALCRMAAHGDRVLSEQRGSLRTERRNRLASRYARGDDLAV